MVRKHVFPGTEGVLVVNELCKGHGVVWRPNEYRDAAPHEYLAQAACGLSITRQDQAEQGVLHGCQDLQQHAMSW